MYISIFTFCCSVAFWQLIINYYDDDDDDDDDSIGTKIRKLKVGICALSSQTKCYVLLWFECTHGYVCATQFYCVHWSRFAPSHALYKATAYAASFDRRRQLSSGTAAAAFVPNSAVNRVQNCTVGATGLTKRKRVSSMPEVWLYRKLCVQEHYHAGR